jgi:alpha-galactosidase
MSLVTVLTPAPDQPLFFLRGAASTYAFGVHASGLLCHLHWGGPLAPDVALAARLESENVAFSPERRRGPGLYPKTGYDTLRYEYPTANTGDFREPAVDVRHADGTHGLRLVYAAHRVLPGKPSLPGLPATYAETPAEAETLEIDLRDEREGVSADGRGGVVVTLSYTVFSGRDVIARSARIANRGPAPVTLTRALSGALDLPHHRHDLLALPGAWARERWVERAALRSGAQWIGSRRGASSHQSHPFFALLEPAADETRGEARGFSLVYSGNHHGGAEVDQLFRTRALLGIHPDGFAWRLEPGASFQTPELVLAYSAEGLGGMSAQFHRLYRERLVRGAWRDRERPVLINNWEATYFDFTADKLAAIARTAAGLGIELFVLDDGWFGKRNDDTTSLGDWVVDRKKLPAGVGDVGRRIEAEGLRFGLWFEPEMVSPDSELHRAHPDWCLHVPGRGRTEGRHQLVLDFSRPEVVDAIFAQVAAVLREAPIGYVKWDMNRHLTEVASAALPAERQGEVFHRHILGVYAFAERLVTEFPDLLIEGCSGGGGRYDPGMLHYTPQFWCSDNTDAIARLRIQHGTSLVYPPCTMGAHVSAVPNHQLHRSTPMRTRGHVALAGQFGFELDLTKLDEADLAESRDLTAQAKLTRHLLRHGDLHRLADPAAGNLAAWMLVSPGRDEAVVTAVLALAEPNWRLAPLRLRGLDPAARYRCVHGPEGEWGGDVLMELGLPLEALKQDFQCLRWHLKRVA